MSTDDDCGDDEWWSTDQVATFLSVSTSTVRAYLAEGRLPEPDRRFGRSPAWKAGTIRTWHAGRPGQGWRKGKPANP